MTENDQFKKINFNNQNYEIPQKYINEIYESLDLNTNQLRD